MALFSRKETRSEIAPANVQAFQKVSKFLENLPLLIMFQQTLPDTTVRLLQQFANQNFLQSFYLTGGTALALQIGHRESEDLDFFNQEPFDSLNLQQKLAPFGMLQEVEITEGTLNVFLQGVKLQFLYYPYQLLEPPLSWNGIQLSGILDIACTKLITISSRGSKKDFVDLFFLLQTYSLPFLFEQLSKKYTGTEYNQAHILKSLVYFEEAEQQPMPRMHMPVEWDEVKEKISLAVKQLPL